MTNEEIESSVHRVLSKFNECVDTALKPSTGEEEPSQEKRRRRKHRYRIWDEQVYIDRIKTFNGYKWFGKPHEVDKSVCAAFGWVSTDRNVVCCQGCRAVLKYDDKNKDEEEYVKDFVESLKTGHKKFCPWSTTNSVSEKYLVLNSAESLLKYYQETFAQGDETKAQQLVQQQHHHQAQVDEEKLLEQRMEICENKYLLPL